MGRSIQDIDRPLFDYGISTCDDLPGWQLRGPLPDLRSPFFVCLGSAQVFGRFCSEPFPQALSSALGLPVLNLGMPGGGPRLYLDHKVLALINRAAFAIVEVMSGSTEGNSEFDSTGSDGVDGIRKSDQRSMHFNTFLAEKLAHAPQALVARVVEETREAWVSRYRELLTAISIPKVLHWFSTVAPNRSDDYSDLWRLLGPFPQLVNRRMISQIVPFADTYVQTIRNIGLPQALWRSDHGIDGADLFDGTLINNYYPSPAMHAAAVCDLLPACKVLASGARETARAGRKSVIIAANAHEGAILADLCGPGATAVSYRQLLEDRGMLPFLAAGKPRFVHLRRRNLLGGYLADRFASRRGSRFSATVYVDPVNFASYVHSTATAERRIAAACKDAELTEMYFEDLVANPEVALSGAMAWPEGEQPSMEERAIALSRVPPEQTAENNGELTSLFGRVLRNVPGAES